MKKSKQIIPDWFNGEVYKKGAKVRNPFSGEEYFLNSKELSIYDFVVGANRFLEFIYETKMEPNETTDRLYRDLYRGLDWFKKYNAKAYMILLD